MKKRTLLTILFFAFFCSVRADEKFEKEAGLLRLMHQFRYTESHDDIRKLLPKASKPKPESDQPDGNTEMTVAAGMFGFPVTGEFNFANGVLVSHGFEIRTKSYKEAHDVFLKCARILATQVKDIKAVSYFPFGLGDADGQDGPADEITLQLAGESKDAWFSLSMEMRSDSVRVSFGGQRVRKEKDDDAPSEGEGEPAKPKPKSKPAGTEKEEDGAGKAAAPPPVPPAKAEKS